MTGPYRITLVTRRRSVVDISENHHQFDRSLSAGVKLRFRFVTRIVASFSCRRTSPIGVGTLGGGTRSRDDHQRSRDPAPANSVS